MTEKEELIKVLRKHRIYPQSPDGAGAASIERQGFESVRKEIAGLVEKLTDPSALYAMLMLGQVLNQKGEN